MNKEDSYWVAGLLEGEGSFMFISQRRLKISCAMSDLDVIERLAVACGGKIYKQKYKANSHHKDIWIWVIEGKNAYDIMSKLCPMMGKRRQAKIKECMSEYEKMILIREQKNILKLNKYLAVVDDWKKTKDSYRNISKRHDISHVTVFKYINEYKRSRRPDIGDSGTDC